MTTVQIIACLTCGVFCGAALYINLVEHPARMSCGIEIAARQWAPSYRRATRMQVPLALISALAGLAAALWSGDYRWLIPAAFIFAVIPFTFLAIMPVNHALLAPECDPQSAETRDFLEKWDRLHKGRSTLSLVAFIGFLILLAMS